MVGPEFRKAIEVARSNGINCRTFGPGSLIGFYPALQAGLEKRLGLWPVKRWNNGWARVAQSFRSRQSVLNKLPDLWPWIFDRILPSPAGWARKTAGPLAR